MFFEIFEIKCYTLALDKILNQLMWHSLPLCEQCMSFFQLFQKPQITNRDYKVGLFETLRFR